MKTKHIQLFYIKERHNPQIGVYYVLMGQLSKDEAKANENSIYGHNVVLSFSTEKLYNDRIEQLRKEGARIQ